MDEYYYQSTLTVKKIYEFVKRNSYGRYYTVRKQHSGETYASILKIAVEYREEVGVLPLPSHLAEMALVSFKVSKKAIMFIFGRNELLQKPSGHGYCGKGSMKLSKSDQFFLLGLYRKDPSMPL